MKTTKFRLNLLPKEELKLKSKGLAEIMEEIRAIPIFRDCSIQSFAGTIVLSSLTTRNFACIYFDSVSNNYYTRYYDEQNNEISPEIWRDR